MTAPRGGCVFCDKAPLTVILQAGADELCPRCHRIMARLIFRAMVEYELASVDAPWALYRLVRADDDAARGAA
jgi:hypothetical protein